MKSIWFFLARTHLLENADFWSIVLLLAPPAVITYIFIRIAECDKSDPNIVGLFLSALIPIVGLVAYFMRLEHDKKSAELYLGSAVASFVFNLVVFLLF